MKYYNSEMSLERFSILNFQFEFVQENAPKNKEINPIEIFKKLDIEIDFGVTGTVKDDNFKIITKIEINPKKNKFGYSIFAEGLGQFKINKGTDEKSIKSLKNSALAININKLRETISYSTFEAPLGSFQLPLIDLSKLLEEKLLFQKKKSSDKLEQKNSSKPVKKKLKEKAKKTTTKK